MVWQLLQSENICILSHVTWCVARLTDPTNGAIVDELINEDLCKRLIELIPLVRNKFLSLIKLLNDYHLAIYTFNSLDIDILLW